MKGLSSNIAIVLFILSLAALGVSFASEESCGVFLKTITYYSNGEIKEREYPQGTNIFKILETKTSPKIQTYNPLYSDVYTETDELTGFWRVAYNGQVLDISEIKILYVSDKLFSISSIQHYPIGITTSELAIYSPLGSSLDIPRNPVYVPLIVGEDYGGPVYISFRLSPKESNSFITQMRVVSNYRHWNSEEKKWENYHDVYDVYWNRRGPEGVIFFHETRFAHIDKVFSVQGTGSLEFGLPFRSGEGAPGTWGYYNYKNGLLVYSFLFNFRDLIIKNVFFESDPLYPGAVRVKPELEALPSGTWTPMQPEGEDEITDLETGEKTTLALAWIPGTQYLAAIWDYTFLAAVASLSFSETSSSSSSPPEAAYLHSLIAQDVDPTILAQTPRKRVEQKAPVLEVYKLPVIEKNLIATSDPTLPKDKKEAMLNNVFLFDPVDGLNTQIEIVAKNVITKENTIKVLANSETTLSGIFVTLTRIPETNKFRATFPLDVPVGGAFLIKNNPQDSKTTYTTINTIWSADSDAFISGMSFMDSYWPFLTPTLQMGLAIRERKNIINQNILDPNNPDIVRAAGFEKANFSLLDYPKVKASLNIKNQANILYLCAHGDHSTAGLSLDSIKISPKPIITPPPGFYSLKKEDWNDNLKGAILYSCGVLDIGDYNENYPKDERNKNPGIEWDNIFTKSGERRFLLGYNYGSPLNNGLWVVSNYFNILKGPPTEFPFKPEIYGWLKASVHVVQGKKYVVDTVCAIDELGYYFIKFDEVVKKKGERVHEKWKIGFVLRSSWDKPVPASEKIKILEYIDP